MLCDTAKQQDFGRTRLAAESQLTGKQTLYVLALDQKENGPKCLRMRIIEG